MVSAGHCRTMVPAEKRRRRLLLCHSWVPPVCHASSSADRTVGSLRAATILGRSRARHPGGKPEPVPSRRSAGNGWPRTSRYRESRCGRSRVLLPAWVESQDGRRAAVKPLVSGSTGSSREQDPGRMPRRHWRTRGIAVDCTIEFLRRLFGVGGGCVLGGVFGGGEQAA